MAKERRSARLLSQATCKSFIRAADKQPMQSLSDWPANMRNALTSWWLRQIPWKEKPCRRAAQNGFPPKRCAGFCLVGDEIRVLVSSRFLCRARKVFRDDESKRSDVCLQAGPWLDSQTNRRHQYPLTLRFAPRSTFCRRL